MKVKFITAVLALSVVTLTQANTFSEQSPTKLTASSHQIDLNKADLSQIIGSIKGIGKKRAEAIIAYRDSHQGFKSLEELAEVKGLGQHFVTANREKLNAVFLINK